MYFLFQSSCSNLKSQNVYIFSTWEQRIQWQFERVPKRSEPASCLRRISRMSKCVWGSSMVGRGGNKSNSPRNLLAHMCHSQHGQIDMFLKTDVATGFHLRTPRFVRRCQFLLLTPFATIHIIKDSGKVEGIYASPIGNSERVKFILFFDFYCGLKKVLNVIIFIVAISLLSISTVTLKVYTMRRKLNFYQFFY